MMDGTTPVDEEKVVMNGVGERHDVTRASYPLPQPLAERLRLAASAASGNGSENSIETESIQSALAELVGNSLEAMDSMYFSSPPHVRQHECFQHRLCIRVRADIEEQTLSITDLGSGMTRADLINSLGIGRQMQSSSPAKKRATTQQAALDDLESSDTESSSDDDDDYESNGEEAATKEAEQGDDVDNVPLDENSENNNKQVPKPLPQNGGRNTETISCKTSDVGGFYAAVCALGLGARVGTKSKFDDYYEFEVGAMRGGPLSDNAFHDFCITRPMGEGQEVSVLNGFDKFEDVRGDSGTRVSIRLNDAAIAAGLLDEEKLKPIFIKILETTQYSVAFSGDEEGARAIIDASAKEKQVLAEILQDNSEQEPIEALAEKRSQNHPALDESYKTVKERAKYIPLRLSLGERKMLRLVEAAMNCCDYTTEVDRKFKSSARRTHEQLKGITAVLRGLVTSCDYAAGQKLLQQENYIEFDNFFRQMFEIARRHKIMNPEKMRTEYGKLIYLLQDAVSPSVQPHLSFSVKGPIESVYKFLEEHDGLALLSDKLIEIATAEILAEKKSRSRIDQEIRQKERAVAILKRNYRSSKLSSDDIHLCLYSICDNNSFLNSDRVPIDKVIDFLKIHFSPDEIEEGYSLAIVSGEDGARLSHSHERQYYFALQSLTLWREIIDDMFRLWAMAEEDLLSDTVSYSLQDTGQGMQRVQQCPRTYQAMQQILVRVQSKVNQWVGSSVIHMGDHNVPNALSFIDKYTQVPRILGPLVSCLENVERICEEDDGVKKMVDSDFGGLEKLRKDILYDFFRSAFDGSGADNFYDAGSCIDGRMTSAWNWCSQLPEKPFYSIFKLTGFKSFDGDFK